MTPSVRGREEKPRDETIDQFRGLAILLMALADFFSAAQAVPPWLKHADDIGYTVIDLIAPLFVFAIGLTFGPSFRRRAARGGRWAAYTHAISRNLALIGLGALLTLGGTLSGLYDSVGSWGLLQALGAAGLIALAVIALPPLPRAAVGLSLLAAYQFLLDRYWLDLVRPATHNGPWGALSWGALLILATCIADARERDRRSLPIASGIAVVAGLLLTLWFPLSKDRASASYIVLSLGLSGLMFAVMEELVARFGRGLPVLNAWGRNALLMYLLHGVVIGAFALPPWPGWYHEAPLWRILLQAALMLAVLSAIGLRLDRRRLYWTL